MNKTGRVVVFVNNLSSTGERIKNTYFSYPHQAIRPPSRENALTPFLSSSRTTSQLRCPIVE